MKINGMELLRDWKKEFIAETGLDPEKDESKYIDYWNAKHNMNNANLIDTLGHEIQGMVRRYNELLSKYNELSDKYDDLLAKPDDKKDRKTLHG